MYEIKEDSIQKWAEEAEKIFASNYKKEWIAKVCNSNSNSSERSNR